MMVDLPWDLLILIVVANGAPLGVALLLGPALARPLDGGRGWFGPHKTWRGLAAAASITPLFAIMQGFSPVIGLTVAVGAMLGDLASSWFKRRLGLGAGAMAPGLDQLPEALLPAALVAGTLGLNWGEVALVTGAFLVVELALSWFMYQLRLRDQPY